MLKFRRLGTDMGTLNLFTALYVTPLAKRKEDKGWRE